MFLDALAPRRTHKVRSKEFKGFKVSLNLVAVNSFTVKGSNDTPACLTITVRVHSFAHTFISGLRAAVSRLVPPIYPHRPW